MRLIVFADGIIGGKIVNFLLENFPEDLALVVTILENDIYINVQRKGIPVCVFESEQHILERLTDDVDLGLLAWWPKILRSPLLESPRNGFINTHPSFLPYNRGKHYNFWALVEEAPFGVTLHKVNAGIDTGDIVFQSVIDYDWCDTGETLYKKAQLEMLDLFINSYPSIRADGLKAIQQEQNIGSFHRSSELEHASKIELDSSYSARTLLNLIRARTFEGCPGCWFEDNGSRYEISIRIKKVM
jgi:methionyl-tRNA formyltransferase